MYTLKGLVEHSNTCQTEIDGKWVPARPINWKCRNFKERLYEAWQVFTGKADAFTWPCGQ